MQLNASVKIFVCAKCVKSIERGPEFGYIVNVDYKVYLAGPDESEYNPKKPRFAQIKFLTELLEPA